jgi:DNA-binding Xre family transcriptional regulator
MTTTEIFLKMVYWLVDNTKMANPTAVARKAGINAANVTKIKTGKNKSVQYETMVKLNNAFGNVFNPEWMRGKSDVMLMADVAPLCSDSVPNSDSVTITTLLAAKDETIASLKRELSAKDDVIAAKDGIISTKDKLIDTLQQQIDDLRMQVASEKGLYTGTAPSVHAESRRHRVAK